jgi:hypothetical protein
MQRDRPRRPFLARPFWRDWVLAYVFIAVGFTVSSPVFPARRVGYVLMTVGGAIFIAAVIHACAGPPRRD